MEQFNMCKGKDCELRFTCHRHTAPANRYFQSYFRNSPIKDGNCKYYWETKN